jgi:hypothetical protein
MVLMKMREIAEAYLGSAIKNAVFVLIFISEFNFIRKSGFVLIIRIQ